MENIFAGLQKVAAGLMALVTGATVSVMPAVSPTPISNIDQSTALVRSGEYSYAGQSVKYILYIPQNGGVMTGTISGFCQGAINGNYAGGEGGNINGTADASCGVAFLRQGVTINYTGQLYPQAGRADVNWEGNIPSAPKTGSLTIKFQPAAL